MTPKRTRPEKERDLVDIALLYVEGKSLVAIHKWLCENRPYQLSYAYVCADLGRIRKIWRERSIGFINERKATELAKLDHIEAQAWEAWHASKKDRLKKFGQRRQTPGGGDGVPKVTHEEVGQETEQRDGNPRFLETALACVSKRLEVLGLEAPRRLQISGPDGGPIPTKEFGNGNFDRDTILKLNAALRETGVYAAAGLPGEERPTGARN